MLTDKCVTCKYFLKSGYEAEMQCSYCVNKEKDEPCTENAQTAPTEKER